MTDAVTREVFLPAPPEEVWRSLTEPELLAVWLAGEAEIDLRPDGELEMRTHDGRRRAGWVEEAEAPRRLCFWWTEAGDTEPTRVAIDLHPERRGTRLVLVESRPMALLEVESHRLSLEAGGGAPGAPEMCAVR